MNTFHKRNQSTDPESKKRPISALTLRPDLMNFSVKSKKKLQNLQPSKLNKVLETVHNNIYATTMTRESVNHPKIRRLSTQLESVIKSFESN